MSFECRVRYLHISDKAIVDDDSLCPAFAGSFSFINIKVPLPWSNVHGSSRSLLHYFHQNPVNIHGINSSCYNFVRKDSKPWTSSRLSALFNVNNTRFFFFIFAPLQLPITVNTRRNVCIGRRNAKFYQIPYQYSHQKISVDQKGGIFSYYFHNDEILTNFFDFSAFSTAVSSSPSNLVQLRRK